ncbi:arsenic resistance N-acetyltransferase ArsN2 [Burkholderia pseudomallei]|uniref:arsenic resistance N-acetyltransferase ArsN2 n=1 Tax=Burkholderia pseudomallei TaxID=28450 RepID=UPI00059ED2E8|nr:arsenic resistance N-acetyltransferase ArsN2 [Burkholderia pseudomallei]ONC62724.1 GCN5 family acetyltransferase [Burkholderia pseudomallei]
MQLRSAAVIDLASIEALLRASDLPTAGVAEHVTNFIVAVDSESVIACGGLEFHDAFALMRSIAVAGDARGAGLGKAIVSSLLTECRRRAIQSVVLLTTTAELYFADQGFVRVTREDVPRPLLASAQFQGVCPGSATTMLKVL